MAHCGGTAQFPAGSAALLIQLSAFFTLGWGVLLFGERLTHPQRHGIVLAAAWAWHGSALILDQVPDLASALSLAAILLALAIGMMKERPLSR